ncbi:hypothetical protein Pla144_32370 [Bythopirellula polymerisocia]|uniref:Carboxypeptidase regulatory-like domain-containing protein n=2 Tax=Bythopirellula polymerisocia TaxID=2528003 RepID=A0A5C6CNC1_9BACT|nr:hypothetical protein Pla144_32370 [Bythopirellula polymerisocia]
MWVATLAGCSKQAEKTAVSGVVSLDGEPVEDGQVSFEPVQGESGKMEFGIIVDGTYSIPAEFGLVPGEYLVRITGNRATGKKAKPDAFTEASQGASLDIMEQYIPPQFNTGSSLKVQIDPVEYLQQDFELISE